jgi:hypothetical protein
MMAFLAALSFQDGNGSTEVAGWDTGASATGALARGVLWLQVVVTTAAIVSSARVKARILFSCDFFRYYVK